MADFPDVSSVATKLRNTLIQYYNTEDGEWRTIKATKNTVIWRKPSEEFNGYLYKTQGIVEDVANRIVDHIRPGPYRLHWDSLMTSMDVVEEFEEETFTMSRGLDVLQMKEDVLKFLSAGTHLGGTNLDFQMEQYICKRKSDGIYIISLKRTWEKLLLAARAIAAIENPADVSVISSRNTGQRAVLKFAAAAGATSIAGCFTPGTFTNQIQAAFCEPRLLVVSDPRADHQLLTEASYVNIPTNSPLRYVDIAIPCNNKGAHSVGLMWWLLAQEVLRMHGTISREHPWEVMPDLYFYQDPEEIEKEECLERLTKRD
uniref:Uncharacterized protein n=1 Tax=Sphaerodactylus townsendi TaxID=933632 RepID=A0ACB8EQ57_9SAUR